jgi:hypothetical protein
MFRHVLDVLHALDQAGSSSSSRNPVKNSSFCTAAENDGVLIFPSVI